MIMKTTVAALFGSCCLLLAGTGLAVNAEAAPTTDTIAKQAYLVDFDTHTVMLDKSAEELMHPASMSKMMTIYMLFDSLKKGKVKLDDEFEVSENAWRKGGAASTGSTMFLPLNSRVKVENLIHGIIIQSGNDACIVVAEGLAGSEAAFAAEMTQKAHEIGLKDSTFTNATGWPDPTHLTTAHDLAVLAERTIRDFPEYYHFYDDREFVFNGIKQGNRNPLLYRNIGADGLKTGHTQISGYGLTASAVAGDRRLILVVNGLPSMQARADESDRLLSWGFREYNNYTLLKPGETIADADVWLGEEKTVPLVAQSAEVITLPRIDRNKMKVTVVYDGPIPAPIAKGQQVATMVVSVDGETKAELPLVAGADVPRLGVFGRLGAALASVVQGAI